MAKKKLKYKVGDKALIPVVIIETDNSAVPYLVRTIRGHQIWTSDGGLIPAPKKRKAKSNG